MQPNKMAQFTAVATPASASAPFTYAWTPKPSSGQGTTIASYSWSTLGQQQISVRITNCNGAGDATASHTVQVTESTQNVYLPQMQR